MPQHPYDLRYLLLDDDGSIENMCISGFKKLMMVKPEALAQQLKEMTAKQYSKEILRL